MALAKNEEISAACLEDEAGWTLSCDCLAALSWEQIACAALKNGLVISLRACASCDKKACAAQIISALAAAKKFLGDDIFFDKVHILEQGDSYEPHGNAISRRELFTFFKRMPLDTAMQLLPERRAGERSELLYRAVLRDLVQERCQKTPKEARTRYTVPLPSIMDNCNGCGTCARMCPEKALGLRETDDARLVTVDVWKCVACGKCTKFCTRKAVAGLQDMGVTHLGTVLIKRLKKEKTV